MDAALSGPTGRVELGTTALKIGCLPENQLVINDAKTSPRHAEVRPETDGYVVVDLGSTDGTFVNEQRLVSHTPQLLRAGDTIRVGDTRYIYEVEDQADPTVYAHPHSSHEPVSLPAGAAQDSVSARRKSPSYQGFSPVYAPPAQAGTSPFSLGYSVQSGAVATPAQSASVPQQEEVAASVPPPPEGKHHKEAWIVWGTVAAFLVLACGVAGTLFFMNRPTPAKTLETFCSDLKNKNGQDAFNLLSDDLKHQSSKARSLFVLEVNSGQIVNCSHSSLAISDGNANAQLTFTYVDGRSQMDTVLLIVDGTGNWKINRMRSTQT